MIPRFDDSVKVADEARVPPSSVMEVAVAETGTAPRFESAATETLPPVTLSPPVWRFVPDRVSVPDPVFANAPEPALVAPLNVVDELSPPDVRVAESVIAPAPAIEPTVSALLFMSSVAPLAIVTAVVSVNTPAAPSVRVPVLMVVVPVYELPVFDTVSVPAPDLVSVIEPDIAPEIVDVPAESTVNPLLPDTAPDTTNVAPESTCTSAADPPTATVPDQVTEPDVT